MGETIDFGQQVPFFNEGIAQPVRLVDGADVGSWIQWFVDADWRAKEVSMSGLESMDEPNVFAGFLEALKK